MGWCGIYFGVYGFLSLWCFGGWFLGDCFGFCVIGGFGGGVWRCILIVLVGGLVTFAVLDFCFLGLRAFCDVGFLLRG